MPVEDLRILTHQSGLLSGEGLLLRSAVEEEGRRQFFFSTGTLNWRRAFALIFHCSGGRQMVTQREGLLSGD